ncbi:MAG: hypothetical protein EBY65_05360 [Acidimicrobiia bacterium]|nr:hypothetical protein [Acidimicrobiia bacterium]
MASTARTATHVDAENADVRWLSEAEQLAWRGWIDASRRVLAATDRQLKRDAGLTTDDYEVFVRLSEAEGGDDKVSCSGTTEPVGVVPLVGPQWGVSRKIRNWRSVMPV